MTVPTYRPQGFTISPKPSKKDEAGDKSDANKPTHHDHPIPEVAGGGMNYQAE